MFLPLVFKSDRLRCLIVGGGDVAAHKIEMLRELGCALTIIAPRVEDSIRSLAEEGSVRWLARDFEESDCRGHQLVIAATASQEVNRAVSGEARALGIPVNVVDDPQLCTVIFPAIWRQRPLTLAVSTEGVAPFMAAAVRDRLARPAAELARWVEAAGRFRAAVRAEISDENEKKRLYREFVKAIRGDAAPTPPRGGRLSDWLAWLERIRNGGQIES